MPASDSDRDISAKLGMLCQLANEQAIRDQLLLSQVKAAVVILFVIALIGMARLFH